MANDLAPAIGDITSALRVLDDHGNLNAAFFEHPLTAVRATLSEIKHLLVDVNSSSHFLAMLAWMAPSPRDVSEAGMFADRAFRVGSVRHSQREAAGTRRVGGKCGRDVGRTDRDPTKSAHDLMRQLEAEVRDTAVRLGYTATVGEVIGKRCSDKPYAEPEQEVGRPPCVVPHR